jgi:hypothetical protein
LWTPDTRIAGKRTDVDDFSLLGEEWFVKRGRREKFNVEYAESAEDAEKRGSGLDAFAAKD